MQNNFKKSKLCQPNYNNKLSKNVYGPASHTVEDAPEWVLI